MLNWLLFDGTHIQLKSFRGQHNLTEPFVWMHALYSVYVTLPSCLAEAHKDLTVMVGSSEDNQPTRPAGDQSVLRFTRRSTDSKWHNWPTLWFLSFFFFSFFFVICCSMCSTATSSVNKWLQKTRDCKIIYLSGNTDWTNIIFPWNDTSVTKHDWVKGHHGAKVQAEKLYLQCSLLIE